MSWVSFAAHQSHGKRIGILLEFRKRYTLATLEKPRRGRVGLVELVLHSLESLKLTKDIELRREIDLDSVGGLVFVVVQHLHAAFFTVPNGLFEREDRFWSGGWPLEE